MRRMKRLCCYLCHAPRPPRRPTAHRCAKNTLRCAQLLFRLRGSLLSCSRALCASLWPLFLVLLPLGLVGHVEQTPAAPLLPCMAAAFASILFGAYLARKGGAMP